MRNFLARLILVMLCLGCVSAFAQSSGKVVADCTIGVPLAYPVGSNSVPTIAQTGANCVVASVSASITGFPTTQTTGTPISVTTSSGAGTLPSGTVVIASNVGATNGAYCKLGATATTSDQLIPPNSWFAFTVGAATQLACITSTSTTTVNMVGGSGLPTGSGGGGGGSGGGAITAASGSYSSGALSSGSIASGAVASGAIASGAYASGAIGSGAVASGAIASGAVASGAYASGSIASGAMVDIGAQADAAAAADNSTASLIALLKRNNQNLTTLNTTAGGAVAAGTARIGYTSDDPCTQKAKTNLPISQNGTSSVQLVGLSGSTVIYVCSLSLIAAGATTIALTTGTGSACVTGNAAVIGSTTANIANSMSLAANGGMTLGNGGGTIAQGAASSELCMILGTNVFVSGNLTYVQQ